MWRRVSIFALMTVFVSCGDCSDSSNTDDPDCGVQCADVGPEDASTTDVKTTPPPPEVVSIRLEPPSVTLSTTLGAEVSETFRVVATLDNGTEYTHTQVNFDLDNKSIGQIQTTGGVFTANALVAGVATVSAEAPALALPAVTATVTVKLEHRIDGPGVPADIDQRFLTTVSDEAFAAQIVYPLDGVVMPQNVYPADIQWLNGASDDLFRVTMTKPNATITAYLTGESPASNHWLVDEAAWRSFAQSDGDAPATIVVDRWEASTQQAYTTTPVTVKFAQAALSGTVYYWDIQAGRIIRIDDGTGQGVAFMPTPPVTPSGERCVGCHSVSNDGQYMVGRLGGGDNVGTVFDLTADLSADPAPSLWPIDSANRWWFSTWNPADDRIMVTRNETAGGLELMDPFTGQAVPVASGALPTGQVTQPAWAPDDSLIAYISGINSWGGEMTHGDLTVLPVTGADSFGTPQTIVSGEIPGAVPGGTSNSYPTWPPDASRIMFAHGGGARSERDPSALYAVNPDGTDVVRLTKANGGPDTTDNYQPNFSPFDQGGYFWMMFLSRRDYGNAQVGTRGTTRQQLWVTAIRKDANPGEDPSEVAYWLPGQSTQSLNISGYWAPRPCRDDGSSCEVGAQCCGGTCAPNESGDLVCAPPPPESCRMLFETCGTTADCCEGLDLQCIDNVCQRIIN